MGTQLEFDFYKEQLGEVAPFPVLKKKWLEEVTGMTGTLPELEYFYVLQTGLSTTASIGSANKERTGIAPPWVPEGAIFAAQTVQGSEQYYRTAQPSCVRASPAYAPDLAGVYQAFGNDELRLTDAGLYVPEPMRTNKCTNYNANPTDLTDVTKSGDVAATLTVVDDSAELSAAGLSEICTSGMVYKLDNSAGTSTAVATVSGAVGNTNAHSLSAAIRGSGDIRVRLNSVNSTPFQPTASYAIYRTENVTPSDTGNLWSLWAASGAVAYFILNQLEEASSASSPIITAGSASTRAADTVTLAAPSGTFDLHLLLDDATEEVIPGFQDSDALPLDLPQGKNIVEYWGIRS